MQRLEERVCKELENIGDKGLTSSNLDTTYKLIDIYKDIKEAHYYEVKAKKYEDWVESEEVHGEHFLTESQDEQINKIMDHIDKLIYELYNYTGTRAEKDIIKRHIDKLKSM